MAAEASTEDNEEVFEGGKVNVNLPINAGVRIFSFLNRDDLDVCRKVCSSWKFLIDYGERELAKREIDYVIISSQHEFSFVVQYKERCRRYVFKKYFKHQEIKPVETNLDIDVAPIRTFKCGIPILGMDGKGVPNDYTFTDRDEQMGFNRRKCCKILYKPLIYRKRTALSPKMDFYSKKLFTPPLAYYERLAWILVHCQVKTLIFDGFAFTDLFVEKFEEYLAPNNTSFCVERVWLHNCKVRVCSPASFHHLFGKLIKADEYYFNKLRFARIEHINRDFLYTSTIEKAKILLVTEICMTNNNLLFRLNIDNTGFMEFVEHKLKKLRERNALDTLPNDSFFGISMSEVEPTRFYKIYKKLPIKPFKHLLFWDERYLDNAMHNVVQISDGVQQDFDDLVPREQEYFNGY